MEDGLILFYIKDNVAYPVALTEEQQAMFKFTQSLIPGPITVVKDKPLGELETITVGGKGNV